MHANLCFIDKSSYRVQTFMQQARVSLYVLSASTNTIIEAYLFVNIFPQHDTFIHQPSCQ
jgi:hypothetical protein